MKGALPCLVLGSGVTALGAIRCLARTGIDVRLVSASPGIAARSRWSHPIPDSPSDSLDSELLAAFLGKVDIDRAVLLPATDAAARAVSGLSGAFRERFPASVPPLDILDLFVDKARFADLLRRRGVPAPVTSVAVGPEVEELVSDRSRDFFLKPTDSQAFFRRFGRKAWRVKGGDEAMARIREAAEAGLTMVAQEYVPGPPTAHVFVDGFVDRMGRIMALLGRRRLRMYPPDFGNSSMMVSVGLGEVRGAVDSLERLLPSVGFRGMFSAEFKQDERDGEFRLLEVNARAWWYVEFAARCGINVCRMAYDDALQREVEPVSGYRTGVRLFYPEYDWSAFRHMHARGELGVVPWIRSWVGAQQPIVALDDPGPGFYLARAFLGRRLGSLIGRGGGQHS